MTTIDYSGCTVANLRALGRGRDLPVSGTAAELRERLEADDARRAARSTDASITSAAATPAPVEAARDMEMRLAGLAPSAGATWHLAQRRVEEAARRLVAARGLGLDDGTQLAVLQRALAALDEAAAAYLTAARRAVSGA